MYNSVEKLQAFYSSEIGSIVQRVLTRHIVDAWDDVHGLRILGCGYATPYLESFVDKKPERIIASMTHQQGACHWPIGKKNLVLLTRDHRMPIENESIDRILLVHHLECSNNMHKAMREVWRVLKPNGRVMVVVPNRMGVWARADWSPFGHGRPFTNTQLSQVLRDSLFTPRFSKSALFVPPLPDSPVMMKSANLIEHMGCSFLPFVAGVHIMEGGKQVYASINDKGSGSPVLAKTKELLSGKPVAVPQRFSTDSKLYHVKDHSDQRRP